MLGGKSARIDAGPQVDSLKTSLTSHQNIPFTKHHYVEVDGVRVFYREAGQPAAPVILLLHGFPSSSFQYRELIPRLADRYRVIAPDLPGFGFTEVLLNRGYKYTFDALTRTIFAFVKALNLNRYVMYVFDYGAPVGYRLAMIDPSRVTAIMSQNGNAYAEGLGDAWRPIQRYWREPTLEHRNGAKAFKKNLPNATVQFLPTGHFAVKTHLEEVVLVMRQFLVDRL